MTFVRTLAKFPQSYLFPVLPKSDCRGQLHILQMTEYKRLKKSSFENNNLCVLKRHSPKDTNRTFLGLFSIFAYITCKGDIITAAENLIPLGITKRIIDLKIWKKDALKANYS